MFSKLLKHEMKAQAGLIGVLSLAALGVGALGGAILWLIVNVPKSSEDEVLITLLTMFGGLAVVGAFFAIMAYLIGVEILLIYRFYKHHFSDEGYLTFTLPVSTHQILLSSILNIAIWLLIAGLVAILGYLMIFAPGIHQSIHDVHNDFLYIFESIDSIFDDSIYFMQAISIFSTFIYGLILPLMSITIGAQVAKKHKLLAAFGIGYGLSTALSFISGILSFISLVGDVAISETSDSVYFIFSMLIPSLLYLGVGIGGYFVMHHLVDKKLNLP